MIQNKELVNKWKLIFEVDKHIADNDIHMTDDDRFLIELLEQEGFAPENHSFAGVSTPYGMATAEEFGHIRLANSLSTMSEASETTKVIPYNFIYGDNTGEVIIDLNDYYLANDYTIYLQANTAILNFPPGWTASSENSAFLEVKIFYITETTAAGKQTLHRRGTYEVWERYFTSPTAFQPWRKRGFQADIDKYATASGTTALTCTMNGFTLTAGATIRIRPASAVGNNATLNITSGGVALGAKQIRYTNNTQIQSGSVAAGTIITLVYDATNDCFFLQGVSPPVSKTLTREVITTSRTWVVPQGITQVFAYLIGGGAGGAQSWGNGRMFAPTANNVYNVGDNFNGEDGSEWSGLINVTPGASIPIIVGAAGAQGASVGVRATVGGDTSFGTSVAAGGKEVPPTQTAGDLPTTSFVGGTIARVPVAKQRSHSGTFHIRGSSSSNHISFYLFLPIGAHPNNPITNNIRGRGGSYRLTSNVSQEYVSATAGAVVLIY